MFKHLPLVLLLCTAFASAATDPIVTQSTSDSNVTTNANTTSVIKSPPPSAISPTINSSNSDLCTVGVAGAVQTQILGISAGATVRDMNCERLKLSKTLYDMGMKVAAISTLCQDKRIFDAMMMAGTPCPYDGLIGPEAKAAWKAAGDEKKDATEEVSNETKTFWGSGAVGALLLLLLL